MRQILTHRMFGRESRVIAAVSGGPDSTALVHLLCEIRDCRWPSLHLHLAHLNHRLRGEESDRDEAFVKELAEKLGLSQTVERIPVAELREGKNLEETARIIRYRFLLRTAKETGADAAATGHNLNDQAETFLMRLLRGAGAAGLSGIRPTADMRELIGREESGSEEDYSCKVARPLLAVKREEIELYLKERGLSACIDSSNASPLLTRNRIRLEIMPRLLEINPRAAEAIARAAEILREETAYLDMRQELEIESSDGAQILSVDSLKEHPQGLRRRLLREAVARARKGLRRVGSAHIEALESLLEEGKSGKRIELPGGATAAREFGKLIIRPTDSSNSADAREENIEETELKAGGECITELFRLEFRVSDGSKPDAPADRWSGFIDLDKTGERLLARFRRAGERYRPAGRRSMEKLKNLMIENRIPLSFRRNWPIIATVNGDFIWSPGLPPAIDFIADATAKRVGFIVANEAADREFRIEKRLRSD